MDELFINALRKFRVVSVLRSIQTCSYHGVLIVLNFVVVQLFENLNDVYLL